MDLKSEYWLSIVSGEYLRDFVRQGGAAVKFAVMSEPESRDALRSELCRVASTEGYLCVSVDAARTKIHMIDHLFHEIARQVDWDALAYAFVRRVLEENSYRLPDDRTAFQLGRIAELNGREEMFLRNELKRWLEQAIFRDYQMSQEFRIAMIRLCLAQLDPEGVSSFLSNAIKEWLRGELRLISTVKEALIFQKVARHNARHMLFSLAHWLRVNGRTGLVLTLDISRYAITKRPKDSGDGIYYSTAAAMDAYEVLRQYIDGADELEGGMIIVLAGPEFIDDDRRGLNRYDALRLRVSDDVHDRRRQNPLASLVRLSPHPEVAPSERQPAADGTR